MFKKCMPLCLLIALFILGTTAHGSLMDGLMVYSSMDTATAPVVQDDGVASDDSGNGHDGQIVGLPENVDVLYDATRGDNVVDLPGETTTDDEYISYGQGSWTDLGTSTSFTISIWLKYDGEVELGHAAQTFAQDYNSVGWNMYGYAPCAEETSRPYGSISAYIKGNGGDKAKCTFTATESLLNSSGWHHLAITFDRTDNKIRCYLDGMGSGSDGNQNGWTSSVNTTSSGTVTNTNDIRLGCSNAMTSELDGQLDDFAMWNRVLSDSEILSIYQGASIVPEPGMFMLIVSAIGGLLFRRR